MQAALEMILHSKDQHVAVWTRRAQVLLSLMLPGMGPHVVAFQKVPSSSSYGPDNSIFRPLSAGAFWKEAVASQGTETPMSHQAPLATHGPESFQTSSLQTLIHTICSPGPSSLQQMFHCNPLLYLRKWIRNRKK